MAKSPKTKNNKQKKIHRAPPVYDVMQSPPPLLLLPPRQTACNTLVVVIIYLLGRPKCLPMLALALPSS